MIILIIKIFFKIRGYNPKNPFKLFLININIQYAKAFFGDF